MAELLAEWLNNEVGLSQKVSDFEGDFANGYLLGELLYKYNQQQDFAQFSRKDVVAHKMGNFEKLEPTLRNLKIKFDSQLVDKIMKRDRGVALRLLYQLKMMLEKVYTPTDVQVLKATGQFADGQPIQKIPLAKETYDGVQHAFFKQRLQALNKPQKTLNMEKHLTKFGAERVSQEAHASRAEAHDKFKKADASSDLRRVQINKLQRNAGFMEEWHQKGVDNWKKNMTIKKDREANQLEFDYKQAEKYNQTALDKLDAATREVNDGIEQFETTLKNQYNISTRVEKDFATTAVNETLKNFNESSPMRTRASEQAMTLTRMDPTKTTKNGAFTLASTGLQHKTKLSVDDRTRKAREKRRARLVTTQYTIMDHLDGQQRETRMVELIKRKSNQEKELDYEVWRTNQCKNLITENRKLRERQYEKRRDLDVQNGVIKEDTLLHSLQEQTHRSVAEMEQRDAEMRNYETDAKTKNRTELCDGLMNAIFDIADEAYNHKQNLDSGENDDRNWREWLQLFKEDMPIAGTHNTLSTSITEETGASNLEAAEAVVDLPNKKLDELELVDYLCNEGQWPADLVSVNKNLIEQIINAPAEAPAAGGKAPPKGKAAAAVQDNTTLDKEDLELDDNAANNYLLGDALEQIIKLNYEARSKLKHPQTPNHLALKLCLVGYPFAGKKVSADYIKETYGLDIFQMEILIEEARAASNAAPAKKEETEVKDGDAVLDNSSKHESEDDSISEDEDETTEAQADFCAIGREIDDLLFSGEEISDEIYVRLFVAKLRITYEYKSPRQKLNEMKNEARRTVEIKDRLMDIETTLVQEAETLSKKASKNMQTEQETLNKELTELLKAKSNGWVLVDFPCTYAQAKLLEQTLSGYQPNVELDPINRDTELSEAMLLVQPTAKEEPPQELQASGLDAVMWFNCPINECLRRADGRYFDSRDEAEQPFMFHVEDVQPPVDQAPLCERLQQQIRENNAISTLMDRFVAFDQQSRSLTRWLQSFGVEEKNRVLMQVIDGNNEQANVQAQVQQVIEQILTHKSDKAQQKREHLEFKIKAMMEQQKRAEEEERRKEEEANKSQTGVSEAIRPDESALLNPSQPGVSVDKASQQKSQQMANDKSAKSIVKDASTSVIGGASAITTVPPGRDNIEGVFQPVILRVWQDMSKNYKSSMTRVLRNVRLHREQVQVKYANIQKSFLGFLHRFDNKQEILQEFVQNFNEFSDEYPDLREDDETKNELHQRTDVVSDELWEIVEERKEHNIEERKKIMESKTVEFTQEFLTTCAKQLMQSELDKFKISIQILQDYYHTIEEKLIPESAPAQLVELAFPEGEDPSCESTAEGADLTNLDSFSYPRLDKLLTMALKQQIVPDVTQLQAASDPKKGGAKKADPKKGAAAKQDDAVTVVEESTYVKEMQESIKTEKSILRFRLVQIRNWALSNLKQNRQTAIDLYKKLDDWIFVAQKAEMDSIEELCIVVKDAIETEAKIQDELCIQFMDFTVDKSILNFITPAPPKLECMEDKRGYKFTIPQLKSLYSELEQLESFKSSKCFPYQTIINILMTKINYSKQFGGENNGVPMQWQFVNLQAMQGMMRNMDSGNTGQVDWRQFFTYLTLQASSLPTKASLEKAKASAGNLNQVNCEQFCKATFWFEANEVSKDRQYSECFDRVMEIKKVLFNTNACQNEEGEMSLCFDDLTEMLRIPYARNNKAKSFADFLFAPVPAMLI